MTAIHAELQRSGSRWAVILRRWTSLWRRGCGRRSLRTLRSLRGTAATPAGLRPLWSLLPLRHRVHHLLAHVKARAESDADPRHAATFVRGSNRYRFRDLELRQLVHVAQHVHADTLGERLLQLVRQRGVIH